MAGVALQGVSKHFGSVTALQDVYLSVADGEIVGLLGPSGCGKTTALRLIAGFEIPDAGEVTVAGKPAAGNGVWVPPERRRIGMVFQDYALFPHLNVADNVAFGLRSRRDAKQRVSEVLQLVGLAEYAKRFPHQLSGGQQQRLALARALAPKPASLLLDEPFSNLDADLRGRMRHEVRSILKHEGVTAIFVTHDQKDAFAICDRVAVMNAGRIEQIGTPRELHARPATEFVARFVGLSNVLPGRLAPASLADGGACVATALGTLPCHPDCPVAAGGTTTEVSVCMRPEWFTLDADGPLSGTVLSALYEGDALELVVSLHDMHVSRPITIRTSVVEPVDPGSTVRFRINTSYVPLVVQNEAALHSVSV